MNDLPQMTGPEGPTPSIDNRRAWWHKARFTLPLLWLLPPIGLLMLWCGKRFPKQMKVFLTVAVGLIMLPRWMGWFSSAPCQNVIVAANSPIAPVATGPLNVEISVTTEVVNGLLYVEATTNLPESTLISISLFRDISGDSYLSQSKATVTDGRFKSGPFGYAGNALPAGEYELSVTVPYARLQPEAVKAIFGEKGMNLTGPLVSDGKYGGRTAEVELIVTVNDNDSLRQLSEVSDSKEFYRRELAALYHELMDFKDNPNFHELGFSPGATQFKEWQIRLEALHKQKSYSNRGAVAASELFELAREYRRSRGAETKYSEMVKPNMLSFMDDAQ